MNGFDRSKYRQYVASKGVVIPFEEDEVKPGNGEAPEPMPPEYSDDTLALRFSHQHSKDLRYTAMWGQWHRWTGTRWEQDQTYTVFDFARRVCREASSVCQNQKIAPRIASAQTVSAVERMARSDRRHAATIDQWDADLMMLNTPAGIVDLKTGEIRHGAREDYCTKITTVGPAGESSECPLWLSFLRRITRGDDELQGFLQRIAGYALTGVTREHALFFLYGTGGNGKSVFLNAISGTMGEYAKTAPVEAFLATKGERHPTDLAGLHNARLVTAIEIEDGRRWAESKIKTLTGGDRISARFMRQDFFEFVPRFKLVIGSNHKPGLRTVDEAIRRRLHLLPFTVSIPKSEQDEKLPEKLHEEWPAILRWAIEGCLAWQREGLNPPEVVTEATDAYLSAEDVTGRWIEDRCRHEVQAWSSSSALHSDYKRWCEQAGEYCLSERKFSEAMEGRGFMKHRTNRAKGFDGIMLADSVPDVPL